MTITEFQGEYRFLSNFWYPKQKVTLGDNIWYPTVEHAYQAAKTEDLQTRRIIRDLRTPGNAKRYARTISLRNGWDEIKLDVMLDLLRQKFAHPVNNDLKQMLLATGTQVLIEGNHWHDNYWGACSCDVCEIKHADNHLGRLLMHVREELR